MPLPSPVADRHSEPGTRIRRARPLLGTRVEIDATAELAAAQLHRAIDAAFAAIERIERLMSYHDPASELSQINREAAARPQRMQRETAAVVRAALDFAALGDGAFDPCVAPRLEGWGLLPRHCAVRAHDQACWRDVQILDDDHVRFLRPLRLDLGGIAKGYAVDQAVQVLQSFGARSVLVNAGGDLRVAGERLATIALRSPHAPGVIVHALALSNAALATSAACYSRRRLGGVEVSALLDPRSGAAYLGAGSVSVRAADCTSADALTKIVLFAAPQTAERALMRRRAQAFVQQPQRSGQLLQA